MKKHLTKTILILSVFSPFVAFATSGVTDFSGLGDFINNIKNNVVVNLSALFLTTAVVAFFYGVVNYVIAIRNGETKGVTDGKNFMLWGLIALFVMFSVWGIVIFAQRTLGIQGQTQIDIPSIRFNDTGGAQANPAGGNGLDSFGGGNGLGGFIGGLGGNQATVNPLGNNGPGTSGTTNNCPAGYVSNGTNCIYNIGAETAPVTTQTNSSGQAIDCNNTFYKDPSCP